MAKCTFQRVERRPHCLLHALDVEALLHCRRHEDGALAVPPPDVHRVGVPPPHIGDVAQARHAIA
jgi:hypothetical protein